MKFKNIIDDIVNFSWVNVSAALYVVFVLFDKTNLSLIDRSELDRLLFLLGLCGSVEYFWYRASTRFVSMRQHSRELFIDLWAMMFNAVLLMLSVLSIIILLRVELDLITATKCTAFTLTSLILSSYRITYETIQKSPGEISFQHRIERLSNMFARVFGFFILVETQGLLYFIVLNVVSCVFAHCIYRKELAAFKIVICKKEKNYRNSIKMLRPALLFFLNGFVGVFDRGLALTSNSLYAPAFFVASLFSRRATIILEANVSAIKADSLKNYSFSRRSIIQTVVLICILLFLTILSAPNENVSVSVLIFFSLAAIHFLTFFFTGPQVEYLISENSVFPIFLALAQFLVIVAGILLIRDEGGVDIEYVILFLLMKATVQIVLTKRVSRR